MVLKYQNILVAIDGSIEAERAFKKAIEISIRNNAKILLVHVIDTRSFAAIEAVDRIIIERTDQYAEELLQKYQKQALDAGVTQVQYQVHYGSPKIKIPKDIAKKQNIDLILCGATGMNAFERFLIGSVSEHIIRYAPCDVLVIRSEKEDS
jgi:nucleotide-binding universal stress UspA family protein